MSFVISKSKSLILVWEKSPLVTEPPDKNITGHIWMESAALGKKTRGLLKIRDKQLKAACHKK